MAVEVIELSDNRRMWEWSKTSLEFRDRLQPTNGVLDRAAIALSADRWIASAS